jgi:hypothetical protein
VVFFRPLRDVLLRQAAAYVRFLRLETVPIANFSTRRPAKSSIQHLTEGMYCSLWMGVF